MTVDNPIQYEVKLVEELWRRGWAAYRTASQSPETPSGADVVAMRDGETVLLNVVILPTGTSTEKVFDENKDLRKSKNRADPVGVCKSANIKVGHAVYRVDDDSWGYSSIGTGKVKATSGKQDLWRVIGA